jgi:hypothetical protein
VTIDSIAQHKLYSPFFISVSVSLLTEARVLITVNVLYKRFSVCLAGSMIGMSCVDISLVLGLSPAFDWYKLGWIGTHNMCL